MSFSQAAAPVGRSAASSPHDDQSKGTADGKARMTDPQEGATAPMSRGTTPSDLHRSAAGASQPSHPAVTVVPAAEQPFSAAQKTSLHPDLRPPHAAARFARMAHCAGHRARPRRNPGIPADPRALDAAARPSGPFGRSRLRSALATADGDQMGTLAAQPPTGNGNRRCRTTLTIGVTASNLWVCGGRTLRSYGGTVGWGSHALSQSRQPPDHDSRSPVMVQFIGMGENVAAFAFAAFEPDGGQRAARIGRHGEIGRQKRSGMAAGVAGCGHQHAAARGLPQCLDWFAHTGKMKHNRNIVNAKTPGAGGVGRKGREGDASGLGMTK